MAKHIHIHVGKRSKDAILPADKLKRKIEKLLKGRKEIYAVNGWSGPELKVTLQDLSRAYVKYETNQDETKFRLTTSGGFEDLNNKIFSL